MKKISLFIVVFISFNAVSQNEAYKKYIAQLKSESKIDSEDKAVFDLLEDFYRQALQSDKGEFTSDMPKKIDKLYQNKKTRNRHLLLMFMAYQDHINQTAAVGKKANTQFQVDLMTDLEREFNAIFNKTPAIIYIYKAEALSSNGQEQESLATINDGLQAYPDSIPMKVYKYLDTKDADVKNDLINNHPNHWMVKQFEIR